MTEQTTTHRELERLDIPEPLRDHQDALAQVVRDVRAGLERGTTRYRDQTTRLQAEQQRQRGAGGTAELAEPTAVFGGFPYQFFDLIAVGPFQFVGPGPFRPSRIVRTGEPAFLLAAVWRNPTPLGFTPGNPSAADVMAGQPFVIRGQTVNVNDVINGPDLGPVNGTFGGGFTDFFFLLIPSVPAPPDGSPLLLDITLTIDVRSVASGLPPFAGYASQWLQLDQEPPFVFPFIPFVGGPIVVPGLVPSFVQDIPVRVMIYT